MRQVPDRRLNAEEEYRNIFESASDGLVIYDIGLDAVVEANSTACKMHGYPYREFIGLKAAAFMLPESYALFREQLHRAKPGVVFASLIVHQRKDGSSFYGEVSRSVISFRGRMCLLSAIRDVSQRIQTEKMLGERIEAQMREQTTLLAISHTLASNLEFQPGLILDQLREIIEYYPLRIIRTGKFHIVHTGHARNNAIGGKLPISHSPDGAGDPGCPV